MVNCDPRLKGPEGSVINVKSRAGKIGVEDDICNLTLNNLTVNGKLTVKGQAEICDIICPEDFTVRAGRDVKLTAARGGSIQCATGPLSLEALSGVTASCTVSVIGHLNAKDTSTSTYKPSLIKNPWNGLVTLLGSSTDTAGKIQLDNNLAQVGDVLVLVFGKEYAQPPVVQISIQGPVSVGQSLPIISIASISFNSFSLRLDVAGVGIRSDIIQYTVIGLD
jgi:hypothetical protein